MKIHITLNKERQGTPLRSWPAGRVAIVVSSTDADSDWAVGQALTHHNGTVVYFCGDDSFVLFDEFEEVKDKWLVRPLEHGEKVVIEG